MTRESSKGFSGSTGKAVGSLNSDRHRTATGHPSMFAAAVAATSANRLRPPQPSARQQQGISPRHSSAASFDLQSCVSGNGNGGGNGVRTQLRNSRS